MGERYQSPLFYQVTSAPARVFQGYRLSVPLPSNRWPASDKRFFDLLPPELVSHVVQQVAATTIFEQRAYRILRKTLHSLCLTSKQLRSLAQPLLLETVIILGDDELRRFRYLVDTRSSAELATIRNFGITECFAEDVYDAQRFDIFAKAATGLQDLRCTLDLTKLTPFLGTAITYLSLSEIKISGITSFSFPQLISLSIHECTIGKGKRGAEIDFHLPSLRNLAFIPLINRAFNPSTTRFLNLVAPSLSTATLSLRAAQHYPPSILKNPSITRSYFTFITNSAAPRTFDITHVEHLQVKGGSFPEVSEYKKLMKLVKSARQLKTLTLPSPPSSSAPIAIAIRHLSQNIVDFCVPRQVSVFYNHLSDHGDFPNYVDPRFVEMVEAKARIASRGARDE
ncbi:hypothetical protein JCM5350_006069 [Sporobolomyces pararoseus]